VVRDIKAALTVSGLAFSPQLLDRPDFQQLLEPMLPAFPQNEEQMAVTVEQWDADLAFDTLDRLGAITAPTLVVVGEQDLLTPPRQAKAVADAIPGARYKLLTGPESSHGLHIERPDRPTEDRHQLPRRASNPRVTEPLVKADQRMYACPEPARDETLSSRLRARVHRFGFKRQHGEDALVYPPQRFTTSHPVQGLQPEGVLTQCE
jgi:hypothetical protein